MSQQAHKVVELDFPVCHPSNSFHWKSLPHDSSDELLTNLEDLKQYFQSNIENISTLELANGKRFELRHYLAVWSCIMGYFEALTTHKDPSRRFSLFPIPIDALCRLVTGEFDAFITELSKKASARQNLTASTKVKSKNDPSLSRHRDIAKTVSNGIWARVLSKPSARDELHSNSVYVALRGNIDKKTLDCFGATVVTVAGLHILGMESYLTLSEDHAYESHYESINNTRDTDQPSNNELKTCELAVPGNTKAAQSKRGKEISCTFAGKSELNPQTSWLYMGEYPVICKSLPMAIAAVISNVTCLIEIQKKTQISVVSGQLYEVKRDLLWILKDGGHLKNFPYAMMELGDCEEHLCSARGETWVKLPNLDGEVLMIESLYHEAISVSRSLYGDGQVYPYCYAGHYHKDAGKERSDQEYRFVEALRLYSNASYVASRYTYERGDSMQLVKVITGVAKVILLDIISQNRNKKEPRNWYHRENAIAAATWLLAFFDSLLLWEERQKGGSGRSFVEILSSSHECSIGNMMQLFPLEIRCEAISHLFDGGPKNPDSTSCNIHNETNDLNITATNLLYFKGPKSKRMEKDCLLIQALQKSKVSIREMELTIPLSTKSTTATDPLRSGRAKRSRRNR